MVFLKLVIKRTIVADLIRVRAWTSSLHQVEARSSGSIATLYYVLNVTRLQTGNIFMGPLRWGWPEAQRVQYPGGLGAFFSPATGSGFTSASGATVEFALFSFATTMFSFGRT